MKGKIVMKTRNGNTGVRVKLKNVSVTDKCVLVDHLLDSLNAFGNERLAILNAVTSVSERECKEDLYE